MAVHELGHVLHAWVSGGKVVAVSIPLLGFSQTIVDPNPHERFVVWGGPVWGAIIPVFICTGYFACRRRVPDPLKFFAGFCLVSNGMYLGMGSFFHAGDAQDLIRLGAPMPLMIALGIVWTFAGLAFWHRTRAMSLKT